jgi:hypothetical protein
MSASKECVAGSLDSIAPEKSWRVAGVPLDFKPTFGYGSKFLETTCFVDTFESCLAL